MSSHVEDEQRRHALIEGCVGTNGHLYRTSAHYKATVDSIVDLLPVWLDNVALEAGALAEAISERTLRLAVGEWGAVPLPPTPTAQALLARLALNTVDDPAASTPSRPVLQVTP